MIEQGETKQIINEIETGQGLASLNLRIEDVNRSLIYLLKTHYRKPFIAVMAFALFCSLLAIFFRADFFIIIGIVVLVGMIAFVRIAVQAEFMRQFATANGFKYQAQGTSEGRIGTIFSQGHSRNLSNLVTGEYLDRPFELYNYQFTVGSGKSAHIYYFTIFEIDFPGQLPHMYLHEKTSGFSSYDSVGSKIDNGHKLALEGDFNDHFTLTVKDQFEIEALQIFTPDLMTKLMDNWDHLSIEFVGKKIYIYEDNLVDTKQKLVKIYELAQFLVQRLVSVSERIGNDVESLDRHYIKNQ